MKWRGFGLESNVVHQRKSGSKLKNRLLRQASERYTIFFDQAFKLRITTK